MRILYVLGFLPTYVKREIEALSEAGCEITVLLPSKKCGNSTSGLWENIAGDPSSSGVKTMNILPFDLFLCSPFKLLKPLSGSLKHLRTLIGSLSEGEFRYFLAASEVLGKLPREWIPDVIHAHFAGDQAHVARIMAGIMGVPYTVTTHATDIFVPRSITRLKRVLRDAGAVITISDFNKDFMRKKGFITRQTAVIKLGIDTGSLPERSGDPSRQEGVCIASGLVEKKGLDVLLESVELLKDEHPELTFKVIGSDPGGALLDEYRTRTKDLPVQFPGVLSSGETLKCISEASFFVLPCVRASNGDMDGIPVAIMEAMGIGVPVVSTRISGIPELIEHGKSGLLAEPGSPESLAEMISRVLQSPEKSEAMGAEGMNSVRALHSPEASAASVLRVLRSVVELHKNKEPE